MKILYFSDIELQTYPDSVFCVNNTENNDIELVIIAGDFVEYIELDDHIYRLEKSLKCIKSNFKNVIYVPGNHELYSTKTKIQVMSFLKKLCKKLNIIFLNDSSVVLKDKNGKSFLFYGSILFGGSFYRDDNINDPDFLKIVKEKFEKSSLKKIKNLTLEKYFAMNTKSIEKLKNLKNPKNLPLICITHYPIIKNMRNPMFDKQIFMKYFYFNNRKDIVAYMIKNKNLIYWISGHTHYNKKYSFENIFVMSNPLGTRKEQKTINKKANYDIVEL